MNRPARIAVSLMLAAASVATIATSPTAPDYASVSRVERLVLDDSMRSYSTHVTATLPASQNGALPDGGVMTARFWVSAFGCLVGVDDISDAGECTQVRDRSNQPALAITVLPDGVDGGVDGGVSLEMPIFENCPVDTSCTQGLTVTVGLAPNELRPSAVRLHMGVDAFGGTASRFAAEPLTLTSP